MNCVLLVLMPEIHLSNFIIILAWSVAALWLAGLIWTRYCLQKQVSLKINKISKLEKEPLVSILVPARNEGHRILEKSIGSILGQTYKNYEVIVLNDRSTDKTKEILENLKASSQNSKLEIIDGKETEKGWLGKPFALRQSYENSKGEWILATDADIIFAPETLQTVINYAEKNNFDALTLVPGMIFGSFWERLFMPVFGWFCVLAMPLHRVNNPNRKESMGVGNFFMFRREVLEKIGGFASVKAEVAEDLRLAEILKRGNFKLRIDYAPALIETRMYSGFREIWEGFTKNLFSGMKFSLMKTFFGVISILLFGVLPFFLAVFTLISGSFALFAPLILTYILQIFVFAVVHRKWQGNMFYALLTPFGLALFLAILINSAIKVLSGRGVTWKGRAIYEKGGVRPPIS